jgi:hypothetical protein
VLTATNMRLGVWLPHPRVVREARAAFDDNADPSGLRAFLLLLWYVLPHPFWRSDPGKHAEREARLWAHVLRLRNQSANGSRLCRLRAALCWRAMQPTLGMLWAEAVGHTSYRATWIYVTDGGHYDNLGLVEALRRGARNIVVLDASGDKANTWFTLGGAMALARADAGVEINLDPESMVAPILGRTRGHRGTHNGRGTPNGMGSLNGAGSGNGLATADPTLCDGQVVRPWARGTFSLTTAHGGLPRTGSIWICKLGWWNLAPWDVRAYAAGHPSFPSDTTLQQLYDGAEFEAYHELGYAAVEEAATAGGLPLRDPAARRRFRRALTFVP